MSLQNIRTITPLTNIGTPVGFRLGAEIPSTPTCFQQHLMITRTHQEMRYLNTTSLYFAAALALNAPMEGFPWNDLRNQHRTLSDDSPNRVGCVADGLQFWGKWGQMLWHFARRGQRMAKVQNGEETLPKVWTATSRAHESHLGKN